MVSVSMILLLARVFAFSFGGDAAVYQAEFERSPELMESAIEAQEMAGYDSWRLMSEPRKMAVIIALYDNPDFRYDIVLKNAFRDRNWMRVAGRYRQLDLSIPEAMQLNLASMIEMGEWL